MDNLDSLLSSVLGEEALMNKIKDTVKGNNDDASSLESVISLISPKLKGENKQNDEIKAEIEPPSEVSGKDNSLSFINSLSHSISKNAGLLLALKPYLSKERCQMIDGVVKISQITDTLKLL